MWLSPTRGASCSTTRTGLLVAFGGFVVTFIQQAFSLGADTDYEGTSARVRAGAELSANNIWSLTFAILIASVGLNVNSTAVIIGAMLISPLMGPIVGTGLALGTDDIALLRQSLRNLLLATVVALIASTLYFLISPLSDAQSELLARTKPTLYDVLIALFGGAAGIVAASRKTASPNVVSGVAIATALMPPLCTAGFGLAHGDLSFFLGALHLYLINALFICLATLGFVRALRFPRTRDPQAPPSRRVHTAIAVLTALLVVPSIYTGWRIIQETRFQRSARRFVTEQVLGSERTMLSSDLHYGSDSSMITTTVLGPLISPAGIDSLRGQLARYGLTRTALVVRQPLQQPSTLEGLREQLRQSLVQDVATRVTASGLAANQQTQLLTAQLDALRAAQFPTEQVFEELATIEPTLVSLALGHQASRAAAIDSARGTAVTVSALATWRTIPSRAAQQRVRAFLGLRLHVDSIAVTHALAASAR